MRKHSVAIVSPDEEQRTVLSMQVNGTGLAGVTQTCSALPLSSKDEALRRLLEAKPQTIVLDIPADSARLAGQIVELVCSAAPAASVLVVGDVSRPELIIDSMRAGAKEFVPRPTNIHALTDAFLRLDSLQKRQTGSGERGRLFAFVNAKGGCGCTTTAVNTALSLVRHGSVVLVDLAPLGHTALQLNISPRFSVQDALQSLHRLDDALLQSIVSRHASGIHLLPAPAQTITCDAGGPELAKLFDVLTSRYRYVVVDLSNRIDAVARFTCEQADAAMILATPDVSALWSASHLQMHLGISKHLRLILNRFRRIPGLSDADIERSTRLSIFSKIPNNYPLISAGIEKGVPSVSQNHSEIARSFSVLAHSLEQMHSETPQLATEGRNDV